MRLATVGLLLCLACNDAVACDSTARSDLDEAMALAVGLRQTETFERATTNDELWATYTRPVRGGYRYLIHDVAVQYARARCWESARAAIDKIASGGVRDSAHGQLAIELAEAKLFDEANVELELIKIADAKRVARDGVADELVRAHRLDEAQTLRRRSGTFENRLDSFFTMHIVSLATHASSRDALAFVSESPRNIEDDHVRNSYGWLLQHFVETGSMDLAGEIADMYARTSSLNSPNRELAIYHAKMGEPESAIKYAERIDWSAFRPTVYFAMAEVAPNPQQSSTYYRRGKNSIEWLYRNYPSEHDVTLTLNVRWIATREGIAAARAFLDGLITAPTNSDDPNCLPCINLDAGYRAIAKAALDSGSADAALEFVRQVDRSTEKWATISVFAELAASAKPPSPDIASRIERPIVRLSALFELLRSSAPKDDVLAVIDAGYAAEADLWLRSDLYEYAAWQIALEQGEEAARSRAVSIEDPLLRARWLLGVTKPRVGGEPTDRYSRQFALALL